MLKNLLFLSSALVIAIATPAVRAADCVYRCGSNEIQFAPGQAVTLQVVNRTGGRVSLERVLDFEPYGMWPDQTITIDAQIGIGDLSVVFWEAAQRPIEVRLHRPEADTLQIELLPSGAVNDSAVHIVNDGRVMIY
ncbi:hypothetical protein QGP82_33465 [Leptothoe sp. LEGE 181152]|uniref:Uncharacterized protein n=1 Tax=Adonisia turfae CCMR0081 TaxID=2292702 RepID=A0A6M0RJL7_9CYAN|nr:hypothetical protein [Adonisia turfae]MDV3353631.1 hypothetical protein [Leptothoe sp. LEGE 181152]NEZ55972.1 hypothetical protein [Adonisia turfae CCMR0081]